MLTATSAIQICCLFSSKHIQNSSNGTNVNRILHRMKNQLNTFSIIIFLIPFIWFECLERVTGRMKTAENSGDEVHISQLSFFLFCETFQINCFLASFALIRIPRIKRVYCVYFIFNNCWKSVQMHIALVHTIQKLAKPWVMEYLTVCAVFEMHTFLVKYFLPRKKTFLNAFSEMLSVAELHSNAVEPQWKQNCVGNLCSLF